MKVIFDFVMHIIHSAIVGALLGRLLWPA
jgi:hypothetical protein